MNKKLVYLRSTKIVQYSDRLLFWNAPENLFVKQVTFNDRSLSKTNLCWTIFLFDKFVRNHFAYCFSLTEIFMLATSIDYSKNKKNTNIKTHTHKVEYPLLRQNWWVFVLFFHVQNRNQMEKK